MFRREVGAVMWRAEAVRFFKVGVVSERARPKHKIRAVQACSYFACPTPMPLCGRCTRDECYVATYGRSEAYILLGSSLVKLYTSTNHWL